LELLGVVTLAALYVTLWPVRPAGTDPAMALVGLALVAVTARRTTERVWGHPPPGVARLWGGAQTMARFTIPLLVGFAVFGIVGALSVRHDWSHVGSELFAPQVLVMLGLYLPWAVVQQTLFQFYLLGRLRVLMPATSPLLVAAVNALGFAAAHWPEPDVMILTLIAGLVWSHTYLRHRSVLPLAVSHALLGTAYFSWVRHSHAVRIFWLALGADVTLG
jgi:hypothetical protein